jgi:hypothetical protein
MPDALMTPVADVDAIFWILDDYLRSTRFAETPPRERGEPGAPLTVERREAAKRLLGQLSAPHVPVAPVETFTVDTGIADAVGFCVLGGDAVPDDAAFARARDLGLVYTNLDKATPHGEGLAVALGWLSGEPQSFPEKSPVSQQETGERDLTPAIDAGVAELHRLDTLDDLKAERIGDEDHERFVVRKMLEAAREALAAAGETGDGRGLREWTIRRQSFGQPSEVRVLSGPSIDPSHSVRVREISSEGARA